MKRCHSPKMDRKTAEKNRRMQMKTLYSKLNSLIPKNHSRFSQEATMLSDQLDEATNYIKTLQGKLEKMKERKDCLMKINKINRNMNKRMVMDFQSPNIDIQDLGPALVVLLICGLDSQLIFYKSICILEEEGVEVVNASSFIMGDKVFHNIHSKISDSKLGFETAKISGRLHKLVHEISSSCL